MYEQEEDYVDEGEDGDEISNEIWQEVRRHYYQHWLTPIL